MVAVARPDIWLNCAVSADGRLAFANGARAHLSGPEDLVRVNQLRSEVAGILVGVGTILKDDPSLRVHWDLLGRTPGPSPARIVLDTRGRTPEQARVLDGSVRTIIAVGEECRRRFPTGIEVVEAGRDRIDLLSLLRRLRGLGLRSILVEGGGQVLASFLRSNLVDRMMVYVAPIVIGGATAPSMVLGPESRGVQDAIALERVRVAPLGEGTLLEYRPRARSGSPL